MSSSIDPDLDERFARWMSAAERVWGDLLVVKDKATMDMWRERALKKHKGEEVDRETWSMRGSGARFVWVTAAVNVQ